MEERGRKGRWRKGGRGAREVEGERYGERREEGKECWKKGGVAGKGEREGRGRKEELRKAFLHGCWHTYLLGAT